MTRKQLLTVDDAITTPNQHAKPCPDCPFARTALRGWLAGETPEQWVRYALGETLGECHVLLPHQCAGMAIFRANTCKSPRDKTLLKLPADRERVFARPAEFLEHHKGKLCQNNQ